MSRGAKFGIRGRWVGRGPMPTGVVGVPIVCRMSRGTYRWVPQVRLRPTSPGQPLIQIGDDLLEDDFPPAYRDEREDWRTDAGSFLKFAAVADRTSAAAFVREWGPLGVEETHTVLADPARGTAKKVTGEWLSAWLARARQLKAAVGLWQAVQGNDVEALGQLFVWKAGRGHREWRAADNRDLFGEQAGRPVTPPSGWGEFHEGDVLPPARAALAGVVNRMLSAQTDARLDPYAVGGPPVLRLVPRTLLAA